MESEENRVEKAAEIVKNGGIIIYPTETVYGLGADINNEAAIKKIFEIKGRGETKAVSIAVKKEDISTYAEVSEKVQELIDKYLPGPLTLVLRKKETVPTWITSNEFVGIRVPENEFAQKLVETCGPITSTSANKTGEPAPVDSEEVSKEIIDKCDYFVEDGPSKYQMSSTIVKIDEKIQVLREGVLELNE